VSGRAGVAVPRQERADLAEQHHEEVRYALAALGPSTTAPRRAIVEVLLAERRLQTPEELLHAARLSVPATSLATVYRTLERLDAAGLVKRAKLASGAMGYGYCAAGHHEHAICLRCGRLQPISPCLVVEEPAVAGFRVTSHVLDFLGSCAACAVEADRSGAAG
jgi:Fur family ferric uptake transcriptional regulator